ncbi:MAG: hypothetical protein JNL71_11635, partial [Rhodospirillales bacterium]|nr:hypothetical protein [Rhodospirillales bacterium]
MAEGTREVLADELTALPKDGKPAAPGPAPASETGLSQPQSQTPGGAQEAANTMGAVNYGTLMGDERSFQPQTPAADQAIEVAAGPRIETARAGAGVDAAGEAQSSATGEAAAAGSLGGERAGEAGAQAANANFTVRGIEVAVPGAGTNAAPGAPGAPTDPTGAPVAAATGESQPAGAAEAVGTGPASAAGPAAAGAAARGGEALTGTAAGSLEGSTTGGLGLGAGPAAGPGTGPLPAAALRSEPVVAPAVAPVVAPSAPPAPPAPATQPVAVDAGPFVAPEQAPAPVEPPDLRAADPSLAASNAAGTEDASVPLNISAALGDADGSETLSITISGVPSGAHLTAGVDNGDGTWTLAPGDLAGLAFVPAANASGTVALQVAATATESRTGDETTRTVDLQVQIAGVADAPTLTATNATGTEDTSVPLNISAALGDTDGSETLSITISGVPSDGHLTAGIDNGDGTWTLAPGDLAGLAYVPGANDSGTFNLGITATATEANGSTSVRNATMSVDVAAVADAPTLTATNATGTEDTNVPLNISAALGDVDGSETLSITISGVPSDGHLTAGIDNGDGTWTLAPGDLAGLAYVPGANDSGTFNLGITATATEANGSTSVRHSTVSVDVAAVADAPTLTATNATGTEDTAVPLNISAALGDVDGSETLS